MCALNSPLIISYLLCLGAESEFRGYIYIYIYIYIMYHNVTCHIFCNGFSAVFALQRAESHRPVCLPPHWPVGPHVSYSQGKTPWKCLPFIKIITITWVASRPFRFRSSRPSSSLSPLLFTSLYSSPSHVCVCVCVSYMAVDVYSYPPAQWKRVKTIRIRPES